VQIHNAGSRQEIAKAKSAGRAGAGAAIAWERIEKCHLPEWAGGWQESREQNP